MKRVIDISVLIGSLILLIVLIFNNEDNRYPNATVLADSSNKHKILASLKDAGFYAHSIQVSVKGHTILLTGIVDNLAEKEAITNIVQSTHTAYEIKNHLLIKYCPYNDLQLANNITRTIRSSASYNIFDWVDVSVNRGTVTLNGVVRDPENKELYRQLVTNINGVKAIRNNLRDLPLSINDERLRFETTKLIYGHPKLINYANRSTPKVHIIVDQGIILLKSETNHHSPLLTANNIVLNEIDDNDNINILANDDALNINSDIISLNNQTFIIAEIPR